MILNITYNVDEPLVEEWLQYLTLTHLPALQSTGLLKGSRTFKIHAEEGGGVNFAIQYITDRNSLEDLHSTIMEHLNEEHSERFGDKVVYFATVLEEISA